MSGRAGPVIIGVAAAGLLLLLGVAVLLGTSGQRIERWIDLPPTGEAAYNPLYGLKLALAADGVQVQSRQRLQPERFALDAGDTVLLLGDPALLARADADALIAFVERGGHLLLRTSPDSTTDAAADTEPGPDAGPALLRAFGIEPSGNDPSCVPLRAGDEPHREFCSSQRFRIRGDAVRLHWGDSAEGYVFARLGHGKGVVDVLANFEFLTGKALEDAPHAALTRALLQPNYRRGVMHLIYAAEQPPLWLLLLQRAWAIWIPALAALLAWLWARRQRFGPLLPAPADGRRSLLEHVHASGALLHRYGHAQVLYAAVRRAFLDRLRRRDALAAALDGEPQIAAIAQRAHMAPGQVRAALTPPPHRDKAALRDRIALLIQLRNRL